jgi:hypothetical protein
MDEETCRDCAWFDDVSEECTHEDRYYVCADAMEGTCDDFEPMRV